MTETPATYPPSAQDPRALRAQRTLALVAKGMESETVAGMAEIARLIETLTVEGLNVSVQELAEIINKDLIVTAKILRAANLVCNNPSFIDVESIEEAIKLVGFNKIRSLALSLLLMENLRCPDAAAVHRKAATEALATSLLTQAWAQIKGRDDAEYAFLYASLRLFGHLLLAAFLPNDFQRAWRDAADHGDFNQSCREVFGLTAHEVGVEHLKTMQFPPALLASLQSFSPSMLTTAERDQPAAQLLLASEMSKQIAGLILDENLSAHEYQAGVRRVQATFQESLRLGPETLRALFAHTEQRIETFGQSFGIPDVARRLARRFSANRGIGSPSAADHHAAQPADAPPRAAPAKAAAAAKATPAPDIFFKTDTPRSKLELLMESIAQANVLLFSPDASNKSGVLVELFQRTVSLCWKPESIHFFWERTEGVYAASGKDALASDTAPSRFTLGERSIFGLATRQNECVRIQDSFDPTIRPHLPSWYKDLVNLRSCLIIPAGDRPGSRLVVCFGWLQPKLLTVTPAEIRALRILLGMIITGKAPAA